MRRRAFIEAALPLLAGDLAWAANSPDLPALIARSKASLVLIGTYCETDSPRFQFHGTGFVVGDGHQVVTNAHVLPDISKLDSDVDRRVVIQIRDAAGQWQRQEVVVEVRDTPHDLVLLRFEGPQVQPLTLGPGDLAPEGTRIVLMGFPLGGALGFAAVTHEGMVSSIAPIALPAPGANGLNARAVRQLREGSFEILQLDAVCYPGNSGGPVIDIDSGRVVGIVNMVLVKGSRESAISQPTGISYAIPVQYVRAMLRPCPSCGD